MEKKTSSEPRRRKIHRSVSCTTKGTSFIGENHSEISGKPLPTEHQTQSDEVDSKTGHHDLKQTETFKTKNRKKALYNKLRRIHVSSPSLFSSASGFENYRGFLNLCILIMILSNFRVALDNVLKYGVLVDPNILLVFLEDPYSWPCASLVVCLHVFIQIAFFVEGCLAKGTISEKLGVCFHIINQSLLLIFPVAVICYYKPAPWSSTLAMSCYLAVWLKLISYAAVNKWCREDKVQGGKKHKDSDDEVENKPDSKEKAVEYPNNLTQRDLYYFMFAPTLCYELNFPRTPRVRYRFLTRRIFEALFLSGLLIALTQQWIVPAVKNSMKPFHALDYPRFVERIMKLAIPNHFLWLIFFYVYFHSLLNIVGEIMRFGDRVFYKDWWNANTVQSFWQNWNIPIHRWAHRHLFQPMLRSGYSKIQASLTVFLLSAVFHELLVSVPLGMMKIWAFTGMIMQVPYAVFVSKFLSGNYGNIAVWISLILGQPVAILMYYHDYFVTHYEVSNSTSSAWSFVYRE
ncbi:diacylglycerol O-acyltransferase 1-like [Rhopilema esculentum]|uniref:diacylglycerol O-acyltransferase 1-like n=1 Tax=Rhopilema esculentum TaxID=499914 RepID=UPI0031E22F4D